MFHPRGPTLVELVRQGLSSTERGYDLLAPKFDYTPFRTPDWLLHLAAARLGASGSIGSALDLCCGTGAAMRVLRPLCRDRVVGVDVSRGMLQVCHERLRLASGSAPIYLVRADVLRLPFREAFDVAVCFGALGHILQPDAGRFVHQVHRSLRPGGRFVFASAEMPPLWSLRYWASRGFNAVMHVRNWLVSPPFVMYYLRFLLPGVRDLLEQAGFEVEVGDVDLGGRPIPLKLVVATRMAPRVTSAD